MTRPQVVGVVLIALGLVYALLYAAWVRRGRAAAGTTDEPAGSVVAARGTYLSTTAVHSRAQRTEVPGLGGRGPATLAVRRGRPDDLVRLTRDGADDLVIPRARLVAVQRDRARGGPGGADRALLLRWRSGDEGLNETRFLPRSRADLDRLESALWWHTAGGPASDPPPPGPPPEPSPEPSPPTNQRTLPAPEPGPDDTRAEGPTP